MLTPESVMLSFAPSEMTGSAPAQLPPKSAALREMESDAPKPVIVSWPNWPKRLLEPELLGSL
jgi:hypothetical protein